MLARSHFHTWFDLFYPPPPSLLDVHRDHLPGFYSGTTGGWCVNHLAYTLYNRLEGERGCREALSETHLPRFSLCCRSCVPSERSNGGAFALSSGVGFSYHTRRAKANRGGGPGKFRAGCIWMALCVWLCPASMGSVCDVLTVLAQGTSSRRRARES